MKEEEVWKNGYAKSQDQVIQDFKAVHGETYDYSKVEYKNAHKKIKIICRVHGEFEQAPKHHRSGSACPFCGVDSAAITRALSYKSVVLKANEVHNNKYSYPEQKITSTKSRIKVVCPIHGEFSILVCNHIYPRRGQASGCKKCSYEIPNNKEGFYSIGRADKNKSTYIRKPCAVYLIHFPDIGESVYKIGISCNIYQRLRNLQNYFKSAYLVTLLESNLYDSILMEKYLHKMLSTFRYDWEGDAHNKLDGWTEFFTLDPVSLREVSRLLGDTCERGS